MRKPLLLLPWLVLAVFLFSGCTLFSSPQNVFSPVGEVSQEQKDLFFLTMWPALAVLILVEAGTLFIVLKFRRKKGDTGLPKQIHGNNKLEIGWTIAPMLLLAAFVPLVVGGIVHLGRTPKDSYAVNVTGLQWQWQFTYADPAGGPPIVVFEEMHIPINTNIAISINAVDVIHSFWVPKLAGKTDAIPGRTNHMWFKGDTIGDYSGQCAEFCGIGHAGMRFHVVVESQADFDAWLKAQVTAQRSGGDGQLALRGN